MVKTKRTGHSSRWLGKAPAVVIGLLMGVLSLFVAFQNAAQAATSSTLNFQARLMTSGGAIVADNTYNVEFKLYNASSSSGSSQGSCSGDANCVWTETRTGADKVTVKSGYLTVNLGSVTAFGSINWDQEHWLTMNIGGAGSPSWDGEMNPRLKLTAVPYAFRAGKVMDAAGTAAYSADDLIQNQTGSDQTANFRISGTGRANTALQAPLLDTATAISLAIGSTNATGISLDQSTVIASGKNLTFTGGASNFDQSASSGTFATGSGAVSLNGDVTIASGKTLTVSGTGATTLGGTLAVTGTQTFTGLGTFNGGLTVAAGYTFTNASSTLFTAVAISDLPTGGNIGTSAATVDVATTFNVNQTTASQTLTLPSPTSTTAGRVVFVNNVGSASFIMGGLTIAAGGSQSYIWNGTAWTPTVSGAGGVSSIGTIDSQTKSADGAVISGTTLYLQTADATSVGVVSTTTQTFAGAKTFSSLITGSAGATVSGAAISLNDSSNFNTSINGGTSTGAITVGNSAAGAITIQNSSANIALNSGTGTVTVTGSAPASVAGSGTAAASALTVTGAAGGATSGTSGQTAGAGAGITFTSGAGGAATGASGSNTGGAAGTILLQGGTGGAATNGTGGTGGIVSLQGGAGGSGTAANGTRGYVGLYGTVFTSTTYSSGSSSTITAASIDQYSTIIATATTTGLTFTMPTTGFNTVAGRVVYITNASSGSNSFTLSYGSQSFSLSTGSTATLVWNGTAWTNAGNDASGLQPTYDAGNTITTTDARNLSVTLADTATDANFLVNIATGSSGKFAIQGNSTDVFSVTSSAITANVSSVTLSQDTNFVLSGGVNGLSIDSTTFSVDSTNHRVGIGTAAPSYRLDVTGTALDAAFGTIARFTGTLNSTTSSGQSTVLIQGTVSPATSVSGLAYNGLYVSPNVGNNNLDQTGAGFRGIYATPYFNSTGTLTSLIGIAIAPSNNSTGTISTLVSLQISNPSNTSGTITTNYGIAVNPQTSGTTDYGVTIGTADTQTLWLSNEADNTGANAGIAFGATTTAQANLYRGAANNLKTDSSLTVVGGVVPSSVSGAGTAASNSLTVSGVTGGASTGTGGATAGAGSAISLTLGTGGAQSGATGAGAGGAGGAFTLQGGTGGAISTTNASGVGGAGSAISLITGTGGAGAGASGAYTGGAGGTLTLQGSAGGAASTSSTGIGGAGGAITLQAGTGGAGGSSGTSGIGGAVSITAGNAGATGTGNVNGGAITLTTGSGRTAGTGGTLTLQGGSGGTTGNGGALSLIGGAGGGSSGSGGAISLTGGAGTAVNSAGGALTFTSGAAQGSSASGNITLAVGAPGATGTNGTVLIQGTAPSSVAGNGTAASNILTVTGVAGGATSGTTGQTGGIGSAITLTLGAGGAASGATGANTGGAGGAFTLQGGTGGATASTTNAATGGAGSALTVTSGTGGAASGASGNTVGGAGGTLTVSSGAGGAVTSATGTPGVGGSLTFTAGAAGTGGSGAANGGSISVTTGAGRNAGTGGTYTVTGGVGGATGTGGALTFVAGAGGSTSGTGGAVSITGGAGTAGNSAGGAITLTTGAGQGSAAGGTLTLQGGTGGATGLGGALSILGGTGQGGANGGTITISGGSATGGGATGLVVLNTPTYSTIANDANCYTSGTLVASTCTIATSSVNSYSAVIVGFSATGQTANMPDPTITTAGRVVYVTAANGSSDFTLSVNGGGSGNTIAMRQNTTATMIWNGSDWTAAGASSSTTLQSAYDSTLTSAGGAEIVLNNSASSDGLTIRNNATSPIIGAILEAQTSIGSNLFSVNNNATEYASNGGAETAGASSSTFPASSWSKSSSGAAETVSRNTTTTGNIIATGQASVLATTTGTATQGTSNQLSTTLTNGLKYQVSFTAKAASTAFTSLDVMYTYDGTKTANSANMRHCVSGTAYYSTGTASQSGTTITGVGTTFTSAMVGMTFVFANGQSSVISGYTNATTLTATTSQTVSTAQTYGIYSAGYTVNTGIWSKITCTFIAPATGTTITSSNAILIRQTDAGSRTFYIDNLSVTVSADVNHAVDGSVDSAVGTNWTAFGSGTAVSRTTSVIYDTSGAVQVDTTNATDRGVTNNLTITPAVSTQYLVTFYGKLSSGTFADLRVRYSRDGGTNFVSCGDYNTQTLSTSSWTKITCILTTDSTTATNPDLVIDQPTAPGSTRTFYVDALTVTLNTNNSSNVQVGGGARGGPTTLLTLDRSSSAPIGANNDAYLGSMYYDTTSGRIQCYEADGWGACGSAPDNIVNLNPEYAGAVLNGSGVGTMTADACANGGGLSLNTTLCSSGEARNYYKWTSPQATSQTYSIYVTYQLPSTFKGFSSDDTVQLTARTDSTSNAGVTYDMYISQNGTVTQCGSGDTTVVTSADTWQTVGINGNEATGCSLSTSSASAFVIFKLNLSANSNANAYVSTLSFTTTGR